MGEWGGEGDGGVSGEVGIPHSSVFCRNRLRFVSSVVRLRGWLEGSQIDWEWGTGVGGRAV